MQDIQAFDDEELDPTKYGEDMNAYLDRKGCLTIERIKDIVGEIISTCEKHMKYDILEYIMKGVVYHKKKLRESFMQEILNASVSAQFGNSIELYINRNNLTIYKSSKDY